MTNFRLLFSIRRTMTTIVVAVSGTDSFIISRIVISVWLALQEWKEESRSTSFFRMFKNFLIPKSRYNNWTHISLEIYSLNHTLQKTIKLVTVH